MTNEQAKNAIIEALEKHFDETGEVGFPKLDLSEFEGLLDLEGTKLGGDMYNFGMIIGKNKVGINSVINDKVER